MAATWMPALALVFGLVGLAPGARAQDCPASQPATERAACLVQAMAEAEAALEVARVDATKAIAGWHGEISETDRAQWRGEFDRGFALWVTFRDKVCAAPLLAREQSLDAARAENASLACRIGISQVIAGDLTNRFGEAVPDKARGHLAGFQRGPNRRQLIGAEGRQPLCRHPGRGGDYAPLTACYERQVARVDAELNAVWARALAAIRARDDLSAADRAGWVELLRAAQRPWAELRDLACRLETYETPNRFANSIYSGLVGPCLIVETEARIRSLKTGYGLR
ncbi:MAG: lysozyme inhibitor LprI family protein [Phreatobacter sp.]